MTLRIISAIALTTTAVMAGFYYAYATVISAQLGADGELAGAAMRRMNAAVERPPFLLLFAASALLPIAAAAWVLFARPASPATTIAVIAGALCAVLAVAVTMVVNVPLNGRLAAGTVDWASFGPVWGRWNLVRMGLSCASAAAFAVALTKG